MIVAPAAGSHAAGRGWARSQDGGVLAVHVGRGEAAHWRQPPSSPSRAHSHPKAPLSAHRTCPRTAAGVSCTAGQAHAHPTFMNTVAQRVCESPGPLLQRQHSTHSGQVAVVSLHEQFAYTCCCCGQCLLQQGKVDLTEPARLKRCSSAASSTPSPCELQAIVDEQSAEAAQQEAAQAPQPPASPLTAPPASQQAASHSQNSPAPTTSDAAAPAANLTPPAMPTTTAAAAAVAAATPAAATPGVTPRPASLLLHTQAANLLTGSPLAATPASRAQTGSGSRQPGAAPSEHRAPAGVGMHAPSQATQNTEVGMLHLSACYTCCTHLCSGCNAQVLTAPALTLLVHALPLHGLACL